MSKTKEQESSDLEELTEEVYTIIVWNDSHNTFEYVIECLMRYCGHQAEQAEQCTYLIHFRGKSDVKRGEKEKMEKIFNKLKSCGLTTTMEEI